MYPAAIVGLLLILPVLSAAVEVMLQHVPFSYLLLGRWLVFWAVGVRLLLAGFIQIVRPRYTADTMLSLDDPVSPFAIRELGFANTAIGIIGTGTLVAPDWSTPATLAGGVFYGLAGIHQVTRRRRNRTQNVAMVSDLIVAAALLSLPALRL